jgi:hypothetical protein
MQDAIIIRNHIQKQNGMARALYIQTKVQLLEEATTNEEVDNANIQCAT